MRRKLASLTLACVLCSTSVTWAVTKYPGLNYIHPLSIRRGETTVVTIDTNGDVKTAYKALIQGEGITAKILPRQKKQPAGIVEVELTVAEDVPVGPREIRIATKEAVTTAGRVYVTDLPIAMESARNDELQDAQEIELPIALNGRVERTLDMDWYKFQAKAGQRVTFAVRAVRLHDTIHKIGRFINHFDAMLILTDENGVELALNDDHYRADPLLSYEFTKDGTYYLCLREATYKGNAFYTYTLVGTTGRWPTHPLPLAVPVGTSAAVHLFGPGYDEPLAAKLTIPDSARVGFPFLTQAESIDGPEPELLFMTSDLETVMESETDKPTDAQHLQLPVGVAGVIGRPGDVDAFTFEAKKGTTYEFEVVGRRLYTALDSQLAIFDAKGKRLAVNDDDRDFLGQQSKDSKITWKAPADATYRLELSDMMSQGGPEYAYHLFARTAEPDFQITCNPDLAMIGPKSRTPIYVKVHRFHGFDEPVALTVENLPAGVTATEPTIPSGSNETCIVLTAADDATIDASNIRIVGHTTLKRTTGEVKVDRPAIPLAEIYQAGYRIPVHTLTVAVTEPSDITVDSPVKEVVLKPGQSFEIPVTLARAEKYKGGRVSLVTDLDRFGRTLPRDIKVDSRKSQLVLTGNQTEGKVVLTADPNAKPIENVPMVVIGQVSVEFSVFVPYCTETIFVSVRP